MEKVWIDKMNENENLKETEMKYEKKQSDLWEQEDCECDPQSEWLEKGHASTPNI